MLAASVAFLNQSINSNINITDSTCIQQMTQAMEVLSAWLASNRLLLTASKTQFIWLGGGRRLVGVDWPLVTEAFPQSPSWMWYRI